MEVKVKMDKFGRILIPKKIREAKGYEYGMELSLVMEPETSTLRMEPVEKQEPYLEMMPWGLPVIRWPNGKVPDYDPVKMIAEGREIRSRVIAGELTYDDYSKPDFKL